MIAPTYQRTKSTRQDKLLEFLRSEDTVSLTPRGRDLLSALDPVVVEMVEAWFVEGQRFASEEAAERKAVELARLLGAKIEIQKGLVSSDQRKTTQVVRPCSDARFREESYHLERRSTIEFVKR